jgi:hypothetical protein
MPGTSPSHIEQLLCDMSAGESRQVGPYLVRRLPGKTESYSVELPVSPRALTRAEAIVALCRPPPGLRAAGPRVE